MKKIKPKSIKRSIKVLVVVSRWNELVTKQLEEGALDELGEADAQVTVVHVPGTWEIPVAIEAYVTKHSPDAVVALGCILQGQTTHGTILGGDVSGTLMRLQLELKTPIAYGILTPDTLDQALDRAGMKHGNKGREAALAALSMISVKDQIADQS